MFNAAANDLFFDGSAFSAVICFPTSQLATLRVPPYRPGASPSTLRDTSPAAEPGSTGITGGEASSRTVDSVNGSTPLLPADCRKTSPRC